MLSECSGVQLPDADDLSVLQDVGGYGGELRVGQHDVPVVCDSVLFLLPVLPSALPDGQLHGQEPLLPQLRTHDPPQAPEMLRVDRLLND